MYQALYRKYRPRTFDEVVGQKSITETLKTQMLTGKLSHAYLFTGTRGTGKTSCAKILAKAVNCESPVDGNPCNRCAACRSIDAGSCMDVQEIDAASNNGVDYVRTLRDEAIYLPAEVKKRVYIIDEVHMLSTPAFNALLKILEEPPEHLLFILATTELHKVPATILSRCQRFSFRRLLPEDIGARLNYAAYQENIDLQPEALRLLSRLADGALRDGMSLLDQCASATDGTLTAEGVYSALGLAGSRQAAALLTAAANKDTRQALALFSEQYAAGKELSAMLDEMTCICRDLLLLKTAPKLGESMLTGGCTTLELGQLLPLFTAAELLRATTLLQSTCAGFATSANRRIDAELCLMQLCEPSLTMDVQALNARLSRLEAALAGGAVIAPATIPKEASAKPAAESGAQLPPKDAAAELLRAEAAKELPPWKESEDTAGAASLPQRDPEDTSGAEPLPQREPEPAVAPLPSEAALPATGADTSPLGFWADFLAAVKPELQPSVRGFFTNSVNAPLKPELRGDTLCILADNGWVKGLIDEPHIKQVLQQKAQELLKKTIRISIGVQGEETAGDPMEGLVDFSMQHSDIIQIKGE